MVILKPKQDVVRFRFGSLHEPVYIEVARFFEADFLDAVGQLEPLTLLKILDLLKHEGQVGGVGRLDPLGRSFDKVEVAPGAVAQGTHQFVVIMQIEVARATLQRNHLVQGVGQLHIGQRKAPSTELPRLPSDRLAEPLGPW